MAKPVIFCDEKIYMNKIILLLTLIYSISSYADEICEACDLERVKYLNLTNDNITNLSNVADENFFEKVCEASLHSESDAKYPDFLTYETLILEHEGVIDPKPDDATYNVIGQYLRDNFKAIKCKTLPSGSLLRRLAYYTRTREIEMFIKIYKIDINFNEHDNCTLLNYLNKKKEGKVNSLKTAKKDRVEAIKKDIASLEKFLVKLQNMGAKTTEDLGRGKCQPDFL